MGNENWPRGTLLVGLPGGAAMAREIEKMIQLAGERDDLNIVMDLSRVGAPSSSCMVDLLRLRRLLRDKQRRLILCNVRAATETVLYVSGLDATFEIARDRLDALSAIRNQSETGPGNLTAGGNAREPILSQAASTSR